MDIHEAWEKALRSTEIMRLRIQSLSSSTTTHVPYIFLSESANDPNHSIVRQGMVVVDKPTIILPPNVPQLDGFEFEQPGTYDEQSVLNFLLVRGVSIPSLKFNNQISSLGGFDGKLSRAIEHYLDYLQQKEDVTTGLLNGPEDLWQFSLLIFICSQVTKNADQDIQRLLDEYKKKGSS